MALLNLSLLCLLFLTASSCQAQEPSLTITPRTMSETLFEGSTFTRVCSITNKPADTQVTLEWLRNGSVVLRAVNTSKNLLQLSLSPVSVTDAGTYVCVATLTSVSDGTVTLTPAQAGELQVLGLEHLVAPSMQVGRKGQDFTLECSYPGGIINWLRDNVPVGSSFSPLLVEHEGNYTCQIIVPLESLPGTSVQVQLQVEVPVEIMSHTLPVYQALSRNQPFSFLISFTGRIPHNLSVTWSHDDVPILASDPRINTTLNSTLSHSALMLPLASRVDAGLYRVVVSSVVGDMEPSVQERTFQLDVTVTPKHPDDLTVTQTSSTTARAMWTLTNRTADEGADSLASQLTYSNNRSLARLTDLPGGSTNQLLEGLAPATNYSLLLTAVNVDGEASSNIYYFTTLEGEPLLNSVDVKRFNSTHLYILADVAYTGGGQIRTVDVRYAPGVTVALQDVELVSGLRYQVWLILEDGEEFRRELELVVSLRNQYDFQSNEMVVRVSEYSESSEPSSERTTDINSSLEPGKVTTSLPLWLIAVIASVVTGLIMILIVACVATVCYKCHSSHAKTRYKMNHTSASDVKSVENGRLPPREGVHSPQHSHGSVENYRSRSQSESLPSTTGGFTPTLDKDHGHKRVPSDCSSNISITKPMLTPSTTASNSPSNMIKLYTSQDKGLGSILEIEGSHPGSDDSGTESERDRNRQLECKEKSISPRTQLNQINADEHRAPGDGSPCDSHQSLAGPAGLQYGSAAMHPLIMSISDTKLMNSNSRFLCNMSPSRMTAGGAEYTYSDCESVASTDVSCGNYSLPPHYHHSQHPHSHHYHHHTPQHCHGNIHLKPVQQRTPTPFNKEYHQSEESMV